MPIPDVFKIEDNKPTTSEWKYTKENVQPHPTAYKQSTLTKKSTSADKFFSSIVTTRYVRTFDGDFHLSFNVNNKEGHLFGVVFR